ncbi:MAG: amino acid racemase, partial [Alphaproteobacteria bacterium]|nr:amino acid racemase [Alphaproteobacteria bacterium]
CFFLTSCSSDKISNSQNASYIVKTLGVKKILNNNNMKIIGLLGGTGWSSTIDYYKLINQMVQKKLGGYHSAEIILKSIDYDDIMSNYGIDHQKTALILKDKLQGLSKLNPDCIIICCNSLHKYYDIVKNDLEIQVPVFHAIELTAKKLKSENYHNVLLLATKFTMEDGFFAQILDQNFIKVTVPNNQERNIIHQIHMELMQNNVTEKAKKYFNDLILKYKHLDAVILGCTELPLAITHENSVLPIIDPVVLQCESAVNYSLD